MLLAHKKVLMCAAPGALSSCKDQQKGQACCPKANTPHSTAYMLYVQVKTDAPWQMGLIDTPMLGAVQTTRPATPETRTPHNSDTQAADAGQISPRERQGQWGCGMLPGPQCGGVWTQPEADAADRPSALADTTTQERSHLDSLRTDLERIYPQSDTRWALHAEPQSGTRRMPLAAVMCRIDLKHWWEDMHVKHWS